MSRFCTVSWLSDGITIEAAKRKKTTIIDRIDISSSSDYEANESQNINDVSIYFTNASGKRIQLLQSEFVAERYNQSMIDCGVAILYKHEFTNIISRKIHIFKTIIFQKLNGDINTAVDS
eukprot:525972_1